MTRTVLITITAATSIATLAGMPSSARSQVVIIIGNGAAQPYYSQPYPYPFPYPHPHHDVVYAEPCCYAAYGYGNGFSNGYYNGYYNNGYYNNGYYRPY